MSTAALSDTIIAIYESALVPDGWFEALQRIASFSGSAGCRIVIDGAVVGPEAYAVVDGAEFRGGGELTFADSAAPCAEAPQPLPIGEAVVRSRLAAPAVLPGSGEPWPGLGGRQPADALAVALLTSAAGDTVLEAIKMEGLFTDAELARLRLIVPHLCRAARIFDGLRSSRLASEMFEASLEALSTGVYFISGDNRVVYLNRVARAQVSSGRVLRLVDDRLSVAADRDAQALLQAELAAIAAGGEHEDRAGRTVALADGAGSGFVAHVLPLRGGAPGRIADHFAAIAAIFVQDPATAPSLANAAFARLYGLTDGELRLLNGLTPGLSLAEAAQALGIGEATAKTHLRRIFAKTRTSRQAELLYLLMTSTPPTCVP